MGAGTWAVVLLVLLIVGLRYAVRVQRKKDDGRPLQEAAPLVRRASTTPSRSGFTWPGPGHFDVEVVGESHYQWAIAAAAEAEEREGALVADLVPEDGNPHDPKAVRVDVLGRPVGYLPREDARTFRRRLASRRLSGQVTQCAATVTGGGETRGGGRLSFGVQLDMKSFDD
jgi:hypothetical protein